MIQIILTNIVYALVAAMLAMAGVSAHAQQAYSTPELAADALNSALATNDVDGLRAVLGVNYRSLIPVGDVMQDDIYRFLEAWSRYHATEVEGDRRARVVVGDSGWIFPAPIVKRQDGWHFDLIAGQHEVSLRQLGHNELSTVETLLALADAQQRYADSVGKGQYARRLISSPGKTDGLYWPTRTEADASPVGPDALAMTSDTPTDEAFSGYHFRVIPTTKEKNHEYTFVAWPAKYGITGIHTFLMSSDRVIYQRDLGPSTSTRLKNVQTLTTGDWRPMVAH